MKFLHNILDSLDDILSYLDEIVLPTDTRIGLTKDETPEKLRFFIVGDWGNADKGARKLARTMGSIPAPDYILSTGDHVYPNGPKSSACLDRTWKNIYLTDETPSLRVPWFLVLGNHDYESDISIQLNYKEPLWNMPSQYYKKSFPCGTRNIDIYFVDTTPYLALANPDYFLRKGFNKKYYRMCDFSKAYADGQLEWLKKELSNSKPNSVRIVVAHYNIFTSGSHGECEKFMSPIFVPIFNEYNVHLYFNGHDHITEHTYNGKTHFFTSGAGCSMLHRVQKNKLHPNNEWCFEGNAFITMDIQDSGIHLEVHSSKKGKVYWVKLDV